MKKSLVRTKNFVADHKVGIAITVTALAGLALNKRTANVYDEFLKEHDLYDAFWTIDE